MNTRIQLSEDMQGALDQLQRIDYKPLEVNARGISLDDFRLVPLPGFIARHLPEGTELRGVVMRSPTIGDNFNTGHGLRLTIPLDFGRNQR